MAEGRFNCIAILDAIPEGELNSARRLRENLEDLSNAIESRLEIRYVRLSSLGDLKSGIDNLIYEIRRTGLKPWIHLEGHGLADESGFLIADGTPCPWEKFKELITPVNIQSGFNVILVLATCYGGSFTRAIVTTDRAPILGLVGPVEEVTSGDIEDGFLAFYKGFFDNSSFKTALNALNAVNPDIQYYRTTAEQFFYEVWAGYKEDYCSEKTLDERIKRIFRKLKKQNLPRLQSKGHIKRQFRRQEKEFFERYRNTYFMYDIDQNNQNRFPVTYESAENKVSR